MFFIESWEIWFLLWAILSIIGIIYCAVTSFWILFGISIVSLIVCIAFHAILSGVLNFYANVGINANRHYGLGYANQRENDLNNSRDTNYSDKPDNQILGEQIIIEERDDNDNDKFLVYNE